MKIEVNNNMIIGFLAAAFIGSAAYGALYINGVNDDNLFERADISLHSDSSQAIGSAGTWYNVTFTHTPVISHNIDHVYDNDTNTTVTILYDGIYDIRYAINVNNTNSNPDDYAYARIVVNDVELNSSGIGIYLSKQNAQRMISGCASAELSAGDEVMLQVTSTSTDTNIEVQSDSYLVHHDSARLCLKKIR